MKTYHLLTLIMTLTGGAALAQDFQAVPPAKRPNAAELAYFGSVNPSHLSTTVPDSVNVQLVINFLADLTNGQFEAAHARLAGDFRAYGPSYQDFLEVDDLTGQWERNGRLFTDQQLQVEETKVITVASGERSGQWVFIKAIWSAQRSQQPGTSIRIPFFELALVRDGKIQQTYVSYGNDRLFYDLGFPIYINNPTLQQAQAGAKR